MRVAISRRDVNVSKGFGREVFFRFVAGLLLVVLISMVGIGLEKQTLQMKRAVSRQYFQKDLLLEIHAKHRLRIQQLTAPSETKSRRANVAAQSSLSNRDLPSFDSTSQGDEIPVPRLPLMRWEHPARAIE